MLEFIPDNLPYTPRGIECLRLGARRGGEGIGCCAIDVFQGFNNDPEAERPDVPFQGGDDRMYIERGDGGVAAVTGTNEEHFLSYLKHGTMSLDPAPDHAFLAVLTDSQCRSSTGKKWLKILKREGFVWVGATSNSVYAEYHPNHIFLLIRSTEEYMDDEEIMALQRPPKAWEELEGPEESPGERFSKLPESIREIPRPLLPEYRLAGTILAATS